jgi:hypothetical protein
VATLRLATQIPNPKQPRSETGFFYFGNNDHFQPHPKRLRGQTKDAEEYEFSSIF